MPKYLLLSIPLVAALVVGLIVYEITLVALHPPSEAQIQAAPSWKETERQLRSQPGIAFDEKRLAEALRRMREGLSPEPDRETTPAPSPDITPEPRRPSNTRRTPHVLMDAGAVWREKLQLERNNAVRKAQKAGLIAGMIALLIGYVGLGIYFTRLSAKRPRQQVRRVGGAVPAATHVAATHAQETPYDESGIVEQHVEDQALAGDEGPYEPYEPPVDISELEKAHQEARQDQEDERTPPQGEA